jgi:hypothetical protein
MNTTPNTLVYMIAGYAVFTVVMAAYLVTLILRFRRLRIDLRLLGEIETK